MHLELRQKEEALKAELRALGSAAVAFSGGVDSTFLLAAAREVLGDRVLAVTIHSCVLPQEEREEAAHLAKQLGAAHRVLDLDFLQIPGVVQNPENRCYFCKQEILKQLFQVAEQEGLAAVIEGSNLDDAGDFRPGLQALQETSAKSPLRAAGLTKAQVRALARERRLPNWNKPSAACLASRIPYGTAITREMLLRVERAERFLHQKGLAQVRVRHHGSVARLEVEEGDFPRFLSADFRREVTSFLKMLGFSYVSLDLQGYRTGSLHESLERQLDI